MPRLLVAWATDTKVMEPLLSCGGYNRTRVSLRTSGEFSLKTYQEFPRRPPRKSSGKERLAPQRGLPGFLAAGRMVISVPILLITPNDRPLSGQWSLAGCRPDTLCNKET